MERVCYCSKILPGKSDVVREHWKRKEKHKSAEMQAAEVQFWNKLKMTGFESWLQPTSQGDYMIHCLEGGSHKEIFKRLRGQMASCNLIALNLRDFYLDVLGKDYMHSESEPLIQSLLSISLPTTSSFIKRAFFYPLLPHKEADHLRFRQEAMGEKRGRHEAMMRAFGVSHLSTWLQNSPQGKYIVVYTERDIATPMTSEARLQQGDASVAWNEIAAELTEHSGLNHSELSPDVEWLTQKL